MTDNENNQITEQANTTSTRRAFLKSSGLTFGGIAIGATFGGLLGNLKGGDVQTEQAPPPPVAEVANPNVALMFFNPEEYQTTNVAVERIFPEDENGPGAMELNAAIYIDHQLASQWGVNARDYRLGPFYNPEPTQGEQIKLLRQDLFRLGLKRLDNYSNENYERQFIDLEAGEQDEVLVAFEKGEAGSISGVSTAEFFKLLRQLTLEGVYADPMYGGNKEMLGWEMRKYPGTRMGYVNEIQKKDFVELEPNSLQSHMGHS
ncbi:gluconate 2-dehydrogenase subunit 3 family protein [Oceanobacillus polygoni]|uniref:Gluconate 2-dehydrogenase gamma chain n=2 Tax=Oceanobacillus polygoni TaxID=1235259 RepID=A0A9X0YQA1_9BACI|nr:gluconate 2-dehydrogenase subunit 3 family protein [Oceanobacillus polygoni]MBP2076935.1 gluconate 2-dehydrogenase gamma chain [Oceanobacillus polygoni]